MFSTSNFEAVTLTRQLCSQRALLVFQRSLLQTRILTKSWSLVVIGPRIRSLKRLAVFWIVEKATSHMTIGVKVMLRIVREDYYPLLYSLKALILLMMNPFFSMGELFLTGLQQVRSSFSK